MTHEALNLFDIIVGLVLVLSAMLSFFRGFVREILSLGAWTGAAIITLYLFPKVAKIFGHHIHNTTLASGFAALCTFTLAMIVIAMASRLLLKFVKAGSDVGLLDHGMGLLFGLARGVFIVAIGYFIFTLAADKGETPSWMKGAVTRPYVAKSARIIARLAPSYIDELANDAKEEFKKTDDKMDLPLDSENDPDEGDESAAPMKNSAPAEKPAPADLPDVEDTLKKAAKSLRDATPKEDSSADWPSPEDLKKRIRETTEDK